MVRAVAIAADHHYGSTVPWFNFVVFRAGVAHENECAGLEIKVVDGLCMLLLEVLHRCEPALKDVGVNGG